MREFVVFARTANSELAEVVGDLGMFRGACAIERFPDVEISVQF